MKRLQEWLRPSPAIQGYLAGLTTAGLATIVFLVASGKLPDRSAAVANEANPSTGSSPAISAPWEAEPETSRAAQTSSATPPQHAGAPLSPEAQARIRPLRTRLDVDPEDLSARKQLAVVLLQHQQLMQAYEHATVILTTHPYDPDGLYVHAVVRLAMGQAPRALELLDEVLRRYPDHALALEAKARAQRKVGDLTGADRSSQRARATSRTHPTEVQKLISAANDGSLAERLRDAGSDGG